MSITTPQGYTLTGKRSIIVTCPNGQVIGCTSMGFTVAWVIAENHAERVKHETPNV